VGILDGQLAATIYAGFRGRLSKGRLLRVGVGESGGLDALGDAKATGQELYGLEGFADDYSDFFRAQAGIPETDVKVCIFGASLPKGIRPLKDDKVALTRAGVETWYQLRRDGVDPAGALWECPGFEIDPPELEPAP